MTWRDIFDGHKVAFTHRDLAAKKARECGYKFLAWNGDVLFILNEKGHTAETGIKTEAV